MAVLIVFWQEKGLEIVGVKAYSLSHPHDSTKVRLHHAYVSIDRNLLPQMDGVSIARCVSWISPKTTSFLTTVPIYYY